MEIRYLGHSMFSLKSKEARLITDPFDPAVVKLKFPRTLAADIVTVTHQHPDHNYTKPVEGNPLIIDSPGEFERKGFRIFGYLSYHDKQKGLERGENIIYKIETEGITLLYCGDLGFVPDASFIDEIGEIDILFVPVGGGPTIGPDEAIEVIKKFEPKIVIPMHFKPEGIELPFPMATLGDFLKKIGAEGTIPVPKLTIKKDDLNQEMKVVVMEAVHSLQ